MLSRTLYTLLLIVSTIAVFAGNPLIRGTWKGYLTSKSLDSDNETGLPVTLFIIDDNNQGQVSGEMTVQYRYQTDIYKAKYSIQGNIDYDNYVITLLQTGMIFYDLLPKGLKWCFGSGSFHIYRSIYGRKTYMDGFMTSDCGAEKMRMILVKK
jgi:hypothetical protein